jgi:hypothetical protein
LRYRELKLCQVIHSSCRQGRLQSARYLHSRLVRLAALLARENPAALKFALSLLGYMRPDTRLPIVELADAAKAEVASAIAAIGEDDLACDAREDEQTDGPWLPPKSSSTVTRHSLLIRRGQTMRAQENAFLAILARGRACSDVPDDIS